MTTWPVSTRTTGDLITAAIWNNDVVGVGNDSAAAKVTAAGDLVQATGANALARLAIGTDGYVLKAGAVASAWAVDPAQDLVTTAGDILYGSAADTLARLAKGTTGHVLKAGASAPEWGTLEGTAVLATGVTDGYVLTADGADAAAWEAATEPPLRLAASNTSEVTTTSTTAVDLLTISDLSITVDKTVRITGNFRKDASAANDVALGLKINSTVVIEAASNTNFALSSATQRAEDGFFDFIIGPRSANYLAGNGQGISQMKVSSSGAVARTIYLMAGALTNLYPNATITSISIRGINVTANNNLAVKDVRVYVLD